MMYVCRSLGSTRPGKMQLKGLEAVYTFLLFSNIVTIDAGPGGLVTTCTSKPAKEGETVDISIIFRRQISLNEDTVYIYLRRGDDPDALLCDRKKPGAQLQCRVLNSAFQSEGLVGYELNLSIPNATIEHNGDYILRVYVNGVQDSPTHCSVAVEEGKEHQRFSASEENNSEILSAVVPSVVGLIIFIIVISIICMILYRRKKRNQEAAQINLEEEMNQTNQDNTLDVEDEAEQSESAGNIEVTREETGQSEQSKSITTGDETVQSQETEMMIPEAENITAEEDEKKNPGSETRLLQETENRNVEERGTQCTSLYVSTHNLCDVIHGASVSAAEKSQSSTLEQRESQPSEEELVPTYVRVPRDFLLGRLALRLLDQLRHLLTVQPEDYDRRHRGNRRTRFSLTHDVSPEGRKT